ncbi:hypothetical protein IMCC3135_04855 [Granulosicoccus antarcticus IMCC3135]|uniref:Uncharacterized protein n=1 Tax=Granulosicoccus antarcticus IMCC3135 TaxID=1192854 RepID=A0A2Z2NVC2_9GAMM|nr:hypothetical protein IMCC3135_04855 [Granulosicoccus antarcticus IMCC3135]
MTVRELHLTDGECNEPRRCISANQLTNASQFHDSGAGKNYTPTSNSNNLTNNDFNAIASH